MSRTRNPVTPAIRLLRERKVAFTEHPYRYEEHGGTAASARELGVDEHSVVKTLIMEDEDGAPMIVLMHGDKNVSTKELARTAGKKRVSPCTPEDVARYTGYMVGGVSPFGTRRSMPVYMEETIAGLPRVYINGGRRGYLVGIGPADLTRVLRPTPVRVAI